MAELVKDPVCNMDVDPDTAAGKSEYQGASYYFCAEGCKQEFDADPQKFLDGGEAPAAEQHAEAAAPAQAAEAPAAEAPGKRWWEFWKA